MNSSEFHDWTLRSLHLDWREATATLVLVGPASSAHTLNAKDVSLLQVPLENPWGKSVSINAVRYANSPHEDVQALEIEMQSGDVIRIHARIFETEVDNLSLEPPKE